MQENEPGDKRYAGTRRIPVRRTGQRTQKNTLTNDGQQNCVGRFHLASRRS